MSEQQSTSRTPILLSAVAVLVAAVAFAVAFYYYDGVTVVTGLVSSALSGESNTPAANPSVASASEQPTLTAAVPEEFALRLWQEQVDSRAMIDKLVAGDIESLQISRVESSSTEATLVVSVKTGDDVPVKGVIGLQRFGDDWFVAFASMDRDGAVRRPDGPLPSIEDVDVALLNTMFDEQAEYQSVLEEYVSGVVTDVDLKTPQPGPNTVTIDMVMHEDHGVAGAQLVAIQSDYRGRPYWFITRFEKTGHSPTE